MKLKEERWRENQLNVNDDQQSGAKPEGDVSHLVLLCFVFVCVCVCVCVCVLRSFLYRPVFTFRPKWSIFASMWPVRYEIDFLD